MPDSRANSMRSICSCPCVVCVFVMALKGFARLPEWVCRISASANSACGGSMARSITRLRPLSSTARTRREEVGAPREDERPNGARCAEVAHPALPGPRRYGASIGAAMATLGGGHPDGWPPEHRCFVGCIDKTMGLPTRIAYPVMKCPFLSGTRDVGWCERCQSFQGDPTDVSPSWKSLTVSV